MLTDAQVIEEWKRRRSTTWQATRIALAVLLISGGTLWYLARTAASDMSGTQLLASFLMLCVLFVAALVVIVRTNKLYRCPRCNDVPGYDGWPVNPERCARCNAVLRDSH
jgi:hypothetical protein